MIMLCNLYYRNKFYEFFMYVWMDGRICWDWNKIFRYFKKLNNLFVVVNNWMNSFFELIYGRVSEIVRERINNNYVL